MTEIATPVRRPRPRAPRAGAPAQPKVEYLVGRKPLRVGQEVLQPGQPVPGAETWPRLESWLRSGALVRKETA